MTDNSAASSSGGGGANTGVIVGCVVGGVILLLCALVALFVYFVYKPKPKVAPDGSPRKTGERVLRNCNFLMEDLHQSCAREDLWIS